MSPMQIRLVLAIGLICLSLPAAAALPPKYQRARELGAVVEAAAARLPEPVEAVEWVEPDLYRVKAGGCTLEVRIADTPPPSGRPPGFVGPRQFEAKAGVPQCR